jgi:hypothetical protein
MRRTRWVALGFAAWLVAFAAPAAAEGIDELPLQQPQRQLAPRAVTLPWLLDDETVGLASALDEMGFVAFGGIGYEGAVSDGEVVTRQLATRPRAAVALAWLVVHGRPAARLYGYWALRHLDPVAARTYQSRLGADRTPVVLVTGCIVRMSTVADAARVADRRELATSRPAAPAQ